MKEQKRYGIILLLLCGIILLAGGDCTAVLFLAPLGLYMLLTKSCIIYRGGDDHARKQ